jgi:tripartite-type tricarboxylate transporter receptor subunit TctC
MLRPFACGLALLTSLAAPAQPFPNKPVRLIGEFTGGSPGDTVMRILAASLQAGWGQPVVVEQRAGGGGVIAAEAVKNSPPDGYTLLGATSNVFVVRPHLAKSNPFDFDRDFVPLSTLTEPTVLLIANPSFGPSSARELIEFAKKNPGKVAYATSGVGSTHHMSGEQINMLAGVELVHVPYKALAQAMGDVIAGQVPLAFNLSGPSLPMAKAGKVKVVAVVNAKRVPALPEAGTIAEVLPQFEMAPTWSAMFAPGGMPPALAGRLSSDIIKGLADPEARGKLAGAGFTVLGHSPEEFSALIRRQRDLVGRIVKAAKIPQTE